MKKQSYHTDSKEFFDSTAIDDSRRKERVMEPRVTQGTTYSQ